MQYIYWNRLQPESCYYRLSSMEVDWLDRPGGISPGEDCGDLDTAMDILVDLTCSRSARHGLGCSSTRFSCSCRDNPPGHEQRHAELVRDYRRTVALDSTSLDCREGRLSDYCTFYRPIFSHHWAGLSSKGIVAVESTRLSARSQRNFRRNRSTSTGENCTRRSGYQHRSFRSGPQRTRSDTTRTGGRSDHID